MRSNCWLRRGDESSAFHKQLHFFAVDILRKMCDDDCRIKSAFQRKCASILSVSGVFGAEGLAGGRFRTTPEAF